MEADGQDRMARYVIVSGYKCNFRESSPTLDSIASTMGLDSTQNKFTDRKACS